MGALFAAGWGRDPGVVGGVVGGLPWAKMEAAARDAAKIVVSRVMAFIGNSPKNILRDVLHKVLAILPSRRGADALKADVEFELAAAEPS